MAGSAAKELRELIRELEAQGFEVRIPKKNSHPQVRKDGVLVTTLASTPSERRGWQNSIARLRRAGFVWQGR